MFFVIDKNLQYVKSVFVKYITSQQRRDVTRNYHTSLFPTHRHNLSHTAKRIWRRYAWRQQAILFSTLQKYL